MLAANYCGFGHMLGIFIKEKVRDLEIFDRWTKVLISKLPMDGVTVDVCDLFYRMTLDVTTDFLLGHSVNSLGKSVDSNSFSLCLCGLRNMLRPMGANKLTTSLP